MGNLNLIVVLSTVCSVLILCFGDAQAGASEAEVTLYTRPLFQGKPRDIYLQQGKCFPLFGEWSSNVALIKLDPGTCVQIYTNSKCRDRPKLLDGQYTFDRDQAANLGLIGFMYRVESLEIC